MDAKKIVVIDDELDIRTFLTAVLSDEGYEVYSAENSRDGFFLVIEHHPKLICLDLLMPEQTGLSLYKEIRSHPDLNDVRVLIVSGLGMEQSLDDVLLGLPGPDAYIEKPIELRPFLATVQSLVGNGRKA